MQLATVSMIARVEVFVKTTFVCAPPDMMTPTVLRFVPVKIVAVAMEFAVMDCASVLPDSLALIVPRRFPQTQQFVRITASAEESV